MGYVTINGDKVLQIMRKVIGQRDASAPDATDDILLEYINEFIQLNMPQDVKLLDNWTFYEFNTVANDYDYDFGADANGVTYSIVRPPAYSINNASATQNSLKMYWHQSPERFYNIWGYITDTDDLTTGQPTDILFYENQFVLRPVPDAVYTIKMRAYKTNQTMEGGDSLQDGGNPIGNFTWDYTYRYIAYGSARDYLRDFLDTETLAQIEPAYQEYRELMLSRTAAQNLSKIKTPRF